MTVETGGAGAALAIMAGLRLEDGRRWGQSARPFQRADVAAVLDPAGPRRHYLLRGRGMSKTTDTAGMALALLLTEAPVGSTSHVYAADEDQAGLLADALAGFVSRDPDLSALVEVSARGVEVRATGARLSIESSDGASAFGTRPWLTIVDELPVWPETTNHRRLWSAIVSSVPKVPGSRLIVIGTAGSPTGLGASVWRTAEGSGHWHTSRTPGPSPWWSPEDVEAARADMSPAEWRRLILCEWAEGDDALTSPADVEAAVRPGSPVLEPRRGVEYVAGLDVGTRRDLTALAVGHAEQEPAGRVVVIDRVMYWRPDASASGVPGAPGRVDLAEVEAAVLRVCRAYGARLRFDRMQAEQMTANLAREGVRAQEYVFSASGANRLARTVYGALRDRAVSLPDDEEVRAEFVSARLVETGPGTVKLQNPPGTHDDIVAAVGMVLADLAERPTMGRGSVMRPGLVADRAEAIRKGAPSRRALGRAPRAGAAIIVPGTANDPGRLGMTAGVPLGSTRATRGLGRSRVVR